jgi:hypothetical protein
MSDEGSPVLSDVIGYRLSQEGLHTEIILGGPDGSKHLLKIDTAALLHLMPIAAASQPWIEGAEAESARTLRTYMDIDRFVLGLDTADGDKLTLTVRLTSGGSLTFHFDRGFARDLERLLASVLS